MSCEITHRRTSGTPALLPRFIRLRDVEAHTGCLYTSGAFELDDREGELRDLLLGEVTRWHAALRQRLSRWRIVRWLWGAEWADRLATGLR